MISGIFLFDTIKLFQDYGIIGTILLLAILVSYMLIKNLTKTNSVQQEKITELYSKLDGFINKFSNDEKHDLAGKFDNYAINANKIQIQLYHILQNYGAERVSIYEFHNGGKNLAGIEFKKCSNTYEAVSLETRPIIKEMQNLPLSVNPLWSRTLVTKTDIIIPSVDKLEDTFLKGYLESQSIKTYYSSILQDYDNTSIGFITLEYYHNAKELTIVQLEEFNEIAIKISVLINIK